MSVKKIYEMKKLAGSLMIVTDTDLPIAVMVRNYRSLGKIGKFFIQIESFIEIASAFHRNEERIEIHFFVYN